MIWTHARCARANVPCRRDVPAARRSSRTVLLARLQLRAGAARHGRGAARGAPDIPSLKIVGFGDVNFSRPRPEGPTRIQPGPARAAHGVGALAAGHVLRRAQLHGAGRRRHRNAAGHRVQRRSRAHDPPLRPERPAEGLVRPVSHADQLLEHRVPSRAVAADDDRAAGDDSVRRPVPAGALRRRARRGLRAGRRLEPELQGRVRQRPRRR